MVKKTFHNKKKKNKIEKKIIADPDQCIAQIYIDKYKYCDKYITKFCCKLI